MPDSPPPVDTEARHERAESARLDNFVDGAFAFAITLLIISGGGLPRTVAELEQALRGVPAFAACFAQLAWFWHSHVSWRDNVRLTDRPSLLLSLLLVFFALIFVFPLHLVYSGAFNGLSDGVLSPGVTTFGRDQGGVAALFVCYGLSYACMAGTLALLHWHGAREADRLTRREADSVRVSGAIWTYVASIGLLSVLLALTLPANVGWVEGLPGVAYFLLALIGPIVHFYRKRLAKRLPT